MMRYAVVALAAVVIPCAAAAQNLTSERGPIERSARPVGADNPIPRRTLEVAPLYPPEAAAVDASGRVTVRVTLDEIGRVAEVRRPAMPPLIFPGVTATPAQLAAAAEALLRATSAAVVQWQYHPPVNPPIAFNVTIGYTPSSDPSILGQDGSAAAARDHAPPAFVSRPTPLIPPDDDPAWAEGAIRIGGDMRTPRKSSHVNPVYPGEARDRRVQGIVIVDVRIGEDGRVSKTRVLSSIPELDRAALDAVSQWEFEPTLLNGQPVAVVMPVVISFSLN